MIEVKGLHIGYKNKEVAGPIDDIFHNGDLVCLLGPNGTGKSTLVKTLTGMIPQLSGQVLIDGKDFHSLAKKEKARLMSIVLTENIGLGNFTVREVIELGRYPYKGWWGKENLNDTKMVNKAIQNTRIGHLESRKMVELSDGEKQKVMIARALAQDTDYILLDEPTSHLDLPSKIEVMALLKELAHQWQKAILVSTHDLNLAIQTADKFWLIDKKGRFESGINEELMLKGALNRCFDLDEQTFDFSTGKIVFPRFSSKSIFITGKGKEFTWTRNALDRLGYQITANAEIKIEVSLQKKWLLEISNNHFEFGSLSEMLAELKKHATE